MKHEFVGELGRAWAYDDDAVIGDPGGFGEVFRGSSQDNELPCAVKRVRLRSGDEEERRRRDREVAAANFLVASNNDRPRRHILMPLDHCVLDDELLIVMPLADHSLRQSLVRGLPDHEKFVAARHTVLGLMELAELAMLHHDIKPGNILKFASDWKLADFGMARLLDDETASFMFRGGTKPYMAPELWRNEPATVKTDLYALGVTLYQIFTGNVPFSGPDFRQQHLHDPVPNAAGVSPAIMRIVLKLLDKEPTRRPQDARAVLELLEVEERMLAYDQERLLKAAAGAEAHASRVAATAATKAAQVQRAKDDRQQAIADLQTIIENSMTQINQALPDIALDTTKAGEWTIVSDVASVSMSVWLDSEIDIQPSKRPRLRPPQVVTS